MNILEFDEMNPRYVEYCRAYGKTPIAMLYWDTFRFPGGKMCGFILWNRTKVWEFASQWKGCRCLADVEEALMGQGFGPDNPKQDVHQLYNEWLHDSVTQDLALAEQAQREASA